MGMEQAVSKLQRIERDTVFLFVLSALLCGIITKSWISSLSLTAGGALMLINFHFLWRFSRGIMERGQRGKGRFLAGLLAMFFLFLGAVACVLLYFKAPMLPFFAGTLSLVAAIFLRGVFLS